MRLIRVFCRATAVCYTLAMVLAGCSGNEKPQPLPPLDTVRVAPPPDQYRLYNGDDLRVKFEFQPEHDTRVVVRPDGKIALDVTGEIQAAGLTTKQLEEAIKKKSSERLRDPEVTVIVVQLGERKVWVGGQVRAPGFVSYYPGLTASQAIMNCGGFTDTAQIDSVLHISQADFGYASTRVDLTDVIEYGAPDPVVLAANDQVFVPRTFVGDAGSFVQLYIRNLLPIPPRFGFGP
jgi:protein involved in polysaccharide export with SLBB domain